MQQQFCHLIGVVTGICDHSVWLAKSNHLTKAIWACSMDAMQSAAQRNAMLVHGLDWSERRAGIFEPAPSDEAAVATTLGLVLNCLSSGLYMVHQCLLLCRRY